MPLSNYSFFCRKKGLSIFLPQKRTLQTIHEFQNNLEKFATIATLGTNQDSTLSQRLNSLVEKESDVPEQVGLASNVLIYLLGQYLAFAKYSWCFPGELFVCTQLPSYHTGCQQNCFTLLVVNVQECMLHRGSSIRDEYIDGRSSEVQSAYTADHHVHLLPQSRNVLDDLNVFWMSFEISWFGSDIVLTWWLPLLSGHGAWWVLLLD